MYLCAIFAFIVRLILNWQPNIKTISQKEQIFCDWRQKFVRLTPEEWVRQQFLHFLIEEMHYPKSRIAVEQQIQVGKTIKRCDAVILDDQLHPVCIVELKAEGIPLTQKVFDQVAVYNRRLQVAYFFISNGENTYACKTTEQKYLFLPILPTYLELCLSE